MTSFNPSLPTITALALFKNEAMNMEEFIRHHVEEGVTEFVLINDGSTDNGPEIAKRVARKLDVDLTIIPASIRAYHRFLFVIHSRITKLIGISTFPSSVRKIKQTMYTNALPWVTKDWLMRVDMDEFWYAESGNIPEYLARLPGDVTSVRVVWQIFCSDGAFLKHPDSLINAYVGTTARGKGLVEKRLGGGDCKTIAKTSEVIGVGVHTIKTRSGRKLEIKTRKVEGEFQDLRLNHYRSQSKEYFLKVQIPRAKQNSLLRTRAPTGKYNEEMFGKLDPHDGGNDTALRDKRNAHTKWMAERIAERGIWPAA